MVDAILWITVGSVCLAFSRRGRLGLVCPRFPVVVSLVHLRENEGSMSLTFDTHSIKWVKILLLLEQHFHSIF